MLFRIPSLLAILLVCGSLWSQKIDLTQPKEYTIGGIAVRGAETTDVQAIKLFAGLKEGDFITLPGDRIPRAIKGIWQQDLFADVSIGVAEVRGESVFLVIDIAERPRLSKGAIFPGASKSEEDDLRDLSPFIPGRMVNENMKSNMANLARKYYKEKGFLDVAIDIREMTDTSGIFSNAVNLNVYIKKGPKIKVNDIIIHGNDQFSERRLRRWMKNTKEKRPYRLFKRSKYVADELEEDTEKLLAKYNESGYRNVKILSDSLVRNNSKTADLHISITEGQQFYFGEITWLGNTKYETKDLARRLGLIEGEVYNRVKLEERLFMSQNGDDVSSLYLDNGYLSFSANPVETRVYNDTVDLQIRIYEGKQYRINSIIIKGNSVTNDHVVMREIRTRTLDLFDRSAIIRTQRELSQLGFFDPAGMNINPIQNPADGTVDIEYTVAEKPSDQIELQGGWGAGRVVGTLGLSFNNFSLRQMMTFKKEAWRPVPKGDGQQLSLRWQTNGRFFTAQSLSFVEPWLGGRRPNSLSVSFQRSLQSNGVNSTITNDEGQTVANPSLQQLTILGGSIGYGMRWKKPDDWFQFFVTGSYQNYDINNFGSIFAFANGVSNNLAITTSIVRDSKSGNPIFPSGGSRLGITTRFTPGGLLTLNKDFAGLSEQDKFRWAQYHKWKFTTEWYTPLGGGRDEEGGQKLVLFAKVGVGYLGRFNNTLGDSPFERFYLGGSALTGFQLDGREIIALRGYDDLSLSPTTGATFINKYTMELRYLLSPNPSATIYGLTFLEAGNTFDQFKDYEPFAMQRSGGVGLRIFLPMFGLMGLDYGWRFDDVQGRPTMPQGQFHFTIGMNLGEL